MTIDKNSIQVYNVYCTCEVLMSKKKLGIFIICIALFASCGFFLTFNNRDSKISKSEEKSVSNENSDAEKADLKPVSPKASEVRVNKASRNIITKKANLYDENDLLPLSAVVKLASLSNKNKSEIESLNNQANVYFLGENSDGLYLIVGNYGMEKYSRHDLGFLKLDENNSLKYTPLSAGEDSILDENDEWEFDEETKQPIGHIKYDNNGAVEYTEVWNYSPDEPVKYEMKNAAGKVLSIKKETLDSDVNIRSEHIVYDENGNTKLNISANYEGPNITRFTYYNSEKPQESVTILTEYKDGQRIKEDVYSADYKLVNTFKAEYENGKRTSINVFNNSGEEVEQILSE